MRVVIRTPEVPLPGPSRAMSWMGRVALSLASLATMVIGLIAPASAFARTPAQIAASAVPGVVSIESTFRIESRPGDGEEVAGTGSGFVLDHSGHILTSEHLIKNATKIHVSFADGTKVHARVVGDDPLLDLAVLAVNVKTSTLHPLVIGFAESLHLGDPLVAIGNPFGLDRSVSVGVASGLHRQVTAPNGSTVSNAVQTDAPINHGNSGGPLLDRNGRVIGVNAQLADSGIDANVGVAFAIAIDQPARRAIGELIAGRNVHHSWVGVSLTDVDAILATSGRVAAMAGALVTGIAAHGPAAGIGIRGGSTIVKIDGVAYCIGGDIVTAVDGRKVMDAAALETALGHYVPGTTVQITVVRSHGKRVTLTVKLAEAPVGGSRIITGCR